MPSTPKQQVLELVRQLPDDVDAGEIEQRVVELLNTRREAEVEPSETFEQTIEKVIRRRQDALDKLADR